MNPTSTYQWTRGGKWYRGRMAMVDGKPDGGSSWTANWLMLTLPDHQLTRVQQSDLELAPEPGVPGRIWRGRLRKETHE